MDGRGGATTAVIRPLLIAAVVSGAFLSLAPPNSSRSSRSRGRVCPQSLRSGPYRTPTSSALPRTPPPPPPPQPPPSPFRLAAKRAAQAAAFLRGGSSRALPVATRNGTGSTGEALRPRRGMGHEAGSPAPQHAKKRQKREKRHRQDLAEPDVKRAGTSLPIGTLGSDKCKEYLVNIMCGVPELASRATENLVQFLVSERNQDLTSFEADLHYSIQRLIGGLATMNIGIRSDLSVCITRILDSFLTEKGSDDDKLSEFRHGSGGAAGKIRHEMTAASVLNTIIDIHPMTGSKVDRGLAMAACISGIAAFAKSSRVRRIERVDGIERAVKYLLDVHHENSQRGQSAQALAAVVSKMSPTAPRHARDLISSVFRSSAWFFDHTKGSFGSQSEGRRDHIPLANLKEGELALALAACERFGKLDGKVSVVPIPNVYSEVTDEFLDLPEPAKRILVESIRTAPEIPLVWRLSLAIGEFRKTAEKRRRRDQLLARLWSMLVEERLCKSKRLKYHQFSMLLFQRVLERDQLTGELTRKKGKKGCVAASPHMFLTPNFLEMLHYHIARRSSSLHIQAFEVLRTIEGACAQDSTNAEVALVRLLSGPGEAPHTQSQSSTLETTHGRKVVGTLIKSLDKPALRRCAKQVICQIQWSDAQNKEEENFVKERRQKFQLLEYLFSIAKGFLTFPLDVSVGQAVQEILRMLAIWSYFQEIQPIEDLAVLNINPDDSCNTTNRLQPSLDPVVRLQASSILYSLVERIRAKSSSEIFRQQEAKKNKSDDFYLTSLLDLNDFLVKNEESGAIRIVTSLKCEAENDRAQDARKALISILKKVGGCKIMNESANLAAFRRLGNLLLLMQSHDCKPVRCILTEGILQISEWARIVVLPVVRNNNRRKRDNPDTLPKLVTCLVELMRIENHCLREAIKRLFRSVVANQTLHHDKVSQNDPTITEPEILRDVLSIILEDNSNPDEMQSQKPFSMEEVLKLHADKFSVEQYMLEPNLPATPTLSISQKNDPNHILRALDLVEILCKSMHKKHKPLNGYTTLGLINQFLSLQRKFADQSHLIQKIDTSFKFLLKTKISTMEDDKWPESVSGLATALISNLTFAVSSNQHRRMKTCIPTICSSLGYVLRCFGDHKHDTEEKSLNARNAITERFEILVSHLFHRKAPGLSANCFSLIFERNPMWIVRLTPHVLKSIRAAKSRFLCFEGMRLLCNQFGMQGYRTNLMQISNSVSKEIACELQEFLESQRNASHYTPGISNSYRKFSKDVREFYTVAARIVGALCIDSAHPLLEFSLWRQALGSLWTPSCEERIRRQLDKCRSGLQVEQRAESRVLRRRRRPARRIRGRASSIVP